MTGKKRKGNKIFGAVIPEGYRPASDYDRFCGKIGHALCLWKPSNKPPSFHAELSKTRQPQQWNKAVVNLRLGHFNFSLTRYWISEISSECGTGKDSNVKTVIPKRIQKNGDSHHSQQKKIPKGWVEMMDISNNVFHDKHGDEPDDAHYLHKCYGLKEFIVMANNVNESVVYDVENMLYKLLEYVAHEYKCHLPVFIKCRKGLFSQTSDPWHYIGFLKCPGFSTSFASFETKNVSSLCNISLTDIAKLFRSKVERWKLLYRGPINVSALIKCHINKESLDHQCKISWGKDCWIEGCDGRPINWRFREHDPLIKFHLYATWYNQVIYEFNESIEDLDLDLLDACKWSIQATVTARFQEPLEDEVLMRFLRVCSLTQTESLFANPQLSSMLKYRRIYKQREEVNASLAMQDSIEPKVRKVTSKLILKPEESFIPVESLNAILDFMFCDAKLQPPQHSNGGNPSTTKTAEDKLEEDIFFSYKEHSKYFESAQLSSLTSRLALCMCIVHKEYAVLGGLRVVNQLWGEFVLEMKYRWEHNCEIKGLEPVEPNADYAELLQKLQILNSCIKKKKARDASSSITDKSTIIDSSTEISSVELSDISELPLSDCIHNSQARATSTNGSLLNLQKLFDRLLAANTFDAANPGFAIGDFVRWCLSEDCMEEMITDEGRAASMNEGIKNLRIKLTNDAWLVLRKGAQRRCPDDDDDEAEKVFHWLASVKPSDLAFGLMPVLIYSAATTLLKHPLCQLGFLREHLTQIINALISHNKKLQCTSSGIKEFKDHINNLILVKDKMATTRFLMNGLGYPNLPFDPDLEKFISDVAEFREVQIETSQGELPSETRFGKLISALFGGDKEILRRHNGILQPYFKEYHSVQDFSKTTGHCQRLCCIVKPDYSRMDAAFTSGVEPPTKITF